MSKVLTQIVVKPNESFVVHRYVKVNGKKISAEDKCLLPNDVLSMKFDDDCDVIYLKLIRFDSSKVVKFLKDCFD